MAEIHMAKTRAEIAACWPVFMELRPYLVEAELVPRVEQQIEEAAFKLIYIKEEGVGVVAILGFRVQHFLWAGKILYIDELCTLSRAHRQGYGGRLLDWTIQYARDQECKAVTLDSGYQRNRAHRLYLNKGFHLGSHHFHMHL